MNGKLKVLDLFSGIGGFSLGLERTGGFETVAFCEYDEKPRKVLRKHWPEIPIYEDVRTLKHDGSIDIICGGYPCQPFSLAGKREGKEDDRHLWPAMFDLIKKHRPAWVIGENVAGHITMGLDEVLTDLESEGYRTRTFVIPAVAVDAKHRRDRLWIVANTVSRRWGVAKNTTVSGQWTPTPLEHTSKFSEIMANPNSSNGSDGVKDRKQSNRKKNTTRVDYRASRHGNLQNAAGRILWPPEPSVGRVANGIPRRMDRLKQLGNSVVPEIVQRIGNAILEAEFQNRSQL